jgi:hypothetical protein
MYMKIALALASLVLLARNAPAESIGIFEGHGDIGTVLHPGSAEFDKSAGKYTLTAAGENMWFANDAFHLVWTQASGDVSLAADIGFIGEGGNAHRKGVLMIRQTLDPDSAYVDIARHGDGLTSLQFRDAKGANTHEIQANMSAPTRLRLEKRGDDFYMSLAGTSETLAWAGGSIHVPMKAPFYVGIGACSHDKDKVETVTFSNVALGTPEHKGKPALHSTLQTIAVSSTDARVTYAAPGRIESPSYSRDGAFLTFLRDGKVERVPVTGGKPEPVDQVDRPAEAKDSFTTSPHNGGLQIWRKPAEGGEPEQLTSDEFNNVLPHVSPDGKQLVFLSYDKSLKSIPTDKEVTLRVMSLTDKKVKVLARLIGGKGTIDAPSWSPDSKRLAFVSYQYLP